MRALELLDLGELEPPEGPSQLWSAELRHPTLLVGLTMERDALYARDRRARRGDARGRAPARRCAARNAAGASETARKALGFEELLAGDVERHEAAHAQLRQAPADLDAQAREACDVIDVTGPREPGAPWPRPRS